LKKVTLKSQEEVFYLRLHTLLVRSDPLDTSSKKNRFLLRDIETLQSRFHAEGLAFLTKTLPLLGKSLDQALVSGRLNVPSGFKRSKANASIPAFLQAYFSLVFDEDGVLRSTASADVIRHLRQILFFAYKLELPYTTSQESVVIDKFKRVDEELDLQCDPLASSILQLAKIITGRVFRDFDHKDIRPRHGPGAVATGEKNDAKWQFARLYNSIHQVYPYYDYYVAGGARELIDRLDWYRSLARHESGVAKVVLVPKDSRGPRLISCEPLEYQWIQQGLGRKLSRFLEYGSPYTRGNVNFTRQEINRDLALSSSTTGRYVTLDLEDASDRVSLEVVRRVFERSPGLLRALEACRTTATKLPDGEMVTLNKFAPMGSALCFPVEAYVFWVIIVAAIVRYTNLPLVKVGKRVFVYGDDIVVPTEWATFSIQGLEAINLKVSASKSCISGKFRESCGMDAFDGIPVTPLRLRTRFSNLKSDGSCLAAYVSLANAFALTSPYTTASQFIWDSLETTYGKIPYGTSRSSYPSRTVRNPSVAFSLNMRAHRWRRNRSFQQVQFLLPSLSSRRIRSKLDGWPRLLKDLIVPPVGDPSQIVLQRSIRIKRRWTTVF
jgi:hypothetical protein